MILNDNFHQQSDPHVHLEFISVSVSYNGEPALQDISFQMAQGDRVAIVGPNGAGKSTLFKALVRLIPLQNGEIFVHGQPLGHHKHCVAYIPQREQVDWKFPVTVMDVVMMGRYSHIGWLKKPTHNDREIVTRAIEEMGIAQIQNHPIGELSGGQQQRVFLARAIAQEPHILLLDEPFTGVDAPTQEAVLATIDRLAGENVTVIVSTHDLDLASRRFESVLLLNHTIIAQGPPEQVFRADILRRAFSGHGLFTSDLMLVDECCDSGEDLENVR